MAPRATKARRTRADIRRLTKVRKDLMKRRPRSSNILRRNATVVLAQGAVAAPKRGFGTRTAGRGNVRQLMKCLDARVPRTLGLPRAVGPYTVIRTTTLHSSSARVLLFCPFFHSFSRWNDWCGVESIDPLKPVNDTGNSQIINMPMSGLEGACEVCPAAMTVQVMNPQSLQTADGVYAMTRVNQQMNLSSSFYTWNDLSDHIISFFSPRMLTGGKLALRGVKCSSYPLDMSEYSNFSTLHKASGAAELDLYDRPSALAPIVFVQNPLLTTGEEPKKLEFMITIEWRVRFDPSNPAAASHTYHPTLSDTCWNDVIKGASAIGHGVEELSEDAATLGSEIGL